MKRLSPSTFKTANGEIVKPDWRDCAATVFVFLHDGHCLACKSLCRQFTERQNQFSEWGARVWLVWRGDFVPEGCQGVMEVGKVRRKWLDGDDAGVLLVDRHGVVERQWRASSGKGFPSPEEVLNAVKQIALQCPE